MAAGGGLVCLVRRPRSYQRRPFLADMADCEVIERYRLLRARIEWLVEELKEELERITVKSILLNPISYTRRENFSSGNPGKYACCCFTIYSLKAFAWKHVLCNCEV